MIEMVRSEYGSSGPVKLSAVLGVTPGAVTSKANSLGLQVHAVHWTAEMDLVIRERYLRYGGRDVATSLGLSQQAVRDRAKKLGVRANRELLNQRKGRHARGNRYAAKWSAEMVAILRKYFPAEGSHGAARRLGIRRSAVAGMARHLKIKSEVRVRIDNRTWSPEMIGVLRDLYPTHGAKRVGRVLRIRWQRVAAAGARGGIRRR